MQILHSPRLHHVFHWISCRIVFVFVLFCTSIFLLYFSFSLLSPLLEFSVSEGFSESSECQDSNNTMGIVIADSCLKGQCEKNAEETMFFEILKAMASNLKAMASNLIKSDVLQPNNDGLHPP